VENAMAAYNDIYEILGKI